MNSLFNPNGSILTKWFSLISVLALALTQVPDLPPEVLKYANLASVLSLAVVGWVARQDNRSSEQVAAAKSGTEIKPQFPKVVTTGESVVVTPPTVEEPAKTVLAPTPPTV